jgi:hypothetical protein
MVGAVAPVAVVVAVAAEADLLFAPCLGESAVGVMEGLIWNAGWARQATSSCLRVSLLLFLAAALQMSTFRPPLVSEARLDDREPMSKPPVAWRRVA